MNFQSKISLFSERLQHFSNLHSFTEELCSQLLTEYGEALWLQNKPFRSASCEEKSGCEMRGCSKSIATVSMKTFFYLCIFLSMYLSKASLNSEAFSFRCSWDSRVMHRFEWTFWNTVTNSSTPTRKYQTSKWSHEERKTESLNAF